MTTELQLGNYLTDLRLHLSPLSIADREEIVREIEAHVRDSTEESGAPIAALLARLGPAEALAAQYRDGLLIRDASRSLSPLVLLRATIRLASKGIFGILVTLIGLFGYLVGGGFVLSGIAKCLFPAHTGAWVLNGNFVNSGTLHDPPTPPAHEILDMWYIPIALTLGSLVLFSTTWAIRTSLRLSHRWQSRL